MKQHLRKCLLTTLVIGCICTTAWADGWKLKNTTVYGAGGYWQDGQKTRIDCSYKKGVFQYERKVTEGKDMTLYNTIAVFSEPKQVYAPGEDIGVRIEFSENGTRSDYTPYARVTVMPQRPNWTKGKGASNKIPATDMVDGQATDAGGRNSVTPPETVTLMAQACTGGSQMAIVYSCNGMDVVYSYDWDGEVVATPSAPMEATSWEEPEEPVDETVSQETEIEEVLPDEPFEEDKDSFETDSFDSEGSGALDKKQPYVKYIVVGGVALLLIALILIVFRRKKDKEDTNEPEYPSEEPEQSVEEQQAPVCPNCGAPIAGNERFCGNCGQKLN